MISEFRSSLVKVDFIIAAPVINKPLINRKTTSKDQTCHNLVYIFMYYHQDCIVIKKRSKAVCCPCIILNLCFKQYRQIPNGRDNVKGKHTQK